MWGWLAPVCPVYWILSLTGLVPTSSMPTTVLPRREGGEAVAKKKAKKKKKM
jgi:hypothetical protein